MIRKILIEIDCNKKTCGKCENQCSTNYQSWCGLFHDREEDGVRSRSCLAAERRLQEAAK